MFFLWMGAVIKPLIFPPLSASAAVVRPVSYTHLRAHETVLDLVCRLLLEKKKTHVPAPFKLVNTVAK